MELWFVNSSNSDSDSRFQSRSPLRNARVGEIEKPRTFQIINGIRELAKTRRFKAWFFNLSPSLYYEIKPRPNDIWAIERLATYGTEMVIICDSPLPASTIMEELRFHGFDTSLFVGAITREDLRRRAGDAGLEEVGRSLNSLNSYYRYNFARGSISPEVDGDSEKESPSPNFGSVIKVL
ncbi:unnamed protein product [Fraxinus pennsylvanica]|uniref:Uncharacterized protein n=1 Tax=Fraxinus pennsylvanica TaxID=56036 RepID=A0AAD2AFB2_9LAMI|nr:unnamed protein product [Fraxinus pennsylvanica]